METAKINAIPRTNADNCNKYRREGFLPGILYGQNHENISLLLNKNEVENFIKQYGENSFLEISINDEIKPVLVKEIQKNPRTNELVHIDLQAVFKDKMIHTHIPIKIKGVSNAERKGGIVQHQLNHVDVKGLSRNMPQYMTVDISLLAPGGKIHVQDLEFSEEITVLTPRNEVILTILNGERQSSINETITEEVLS